MVLMNQEPEVVYAGHVNVSPAVDQQDRVDLWLHPSQGPHRSHPGLWPARPLCRSYLSWVEPWLSALSALSGTVGALSGNVGTLSALSDDIMSGIFDAKVHGTGYGPYCDGGWVHLSRGGAATPRLGDWIPARPRSTAVQISICDELPSTR